MNALVLVNTGGADATATLLAGTAITPTSGTLMLTTTDGTARRVTLEGGTVNFGAAEGIVIASRREHLLRSQLSGSNGLTITGDGQLTLDNASNNFVGDVRVSLGGSPLAGAIGLFIQNDGSLGAASNDLIVDGSSFRFNTAFTMNANRTLNIGPAGATIDTNNLAVGVAGPVTGSGPLYKTNSNTLTFSNEGNNYSGETFIFQGNLVTNTGPQGNIHHYAADNGGFAGTNRILTFSQTFDGTYGGNIDGVGDVTKAGTGRATFTGNHTYTGTTVITAGTLVVNGSISGSTTTVNTGRLEGNGTIAFNVVVGNAIGAADAVLAAGDGLGTLTVGGNVNFAGDGAFELQINSTTKTTDRLAAGGILTLGLGVVPLTAFDLGGGALNIGDVFRFIEATGGVSGQFAGLPDGASLFVGANEFTIDYSATTIDLVAVPEPGAVASLLGGLAMLVGFHRSRRARA